MNSEKRKDLLDGIEDLGWINKDEFEYYCDSCGYEGDTCNYTRIDQEYDFDGYPVEEERYAETCVQCGYIFGY